MKSYAVYVLLVIFSGFALADSDPIVIKSKDGRPLKVSLARLDGQTVHFTNLANKKVYKVPLSSLAEDSQKKIQEWSAAGGGLSAKIELETDMVRSNKKSKIEDYDDRHVIISPKTTITNKDHVVSTVPLEATFVVLARPILRKNRLRVISKETREVGSLEKRESEVVHFEPCEIFYDNKGGAQFGAKYMGYVCVITSDGKVVATEVRPKSLEGIAPETFLEVAAKKSYPKDFKSLVGKSYRR